MATLEKIRSKSVLLFVVIIVALLAFILGDLFKSGRMASGVGTTIYKAGSVKVDQQAYKQAYDQQQEQYKQQQDQLPQNQRQPLDGEVLEQTVLQGLLQQDLLAQQYKQLGINVTDAEISKVMKSGHPYSAQFMQYAAYLLNRPTIDGNTVYDIITNPSRHPYPQEVVQHLKETWLQQEALVENQIQQSAYNSLLGGLFTANQLDAKAQYEDNMNRVALTYVGVPIVSDASEVEVSDADVRKQWENTKYNYYLREPQRVVDIIAVPIVPSNEDKQAAALQVQEVLKGLNEQPGLDILANYTNFIATTQDIPTNEVKTTADLRNFPDSLLNKEGAVAQLHGGRMNTYTLAKVLGTSSKVDSLEVTWYVCKDKQELDSVFELVKANGFDGLNEQQTQKNAELVVNGPKKNFQDVKMIEFFLNQAVGTPAVYTDSVQGINLIARVDKRKAPKNFMEIATIKYDVEASPQTESDLWNSLSGLVASNPKANLISDVAADSAAFQVNTTVVSASSPHIAINQSLQLDGSRQAIKWIMEKAKQGDVSKVYRSGFVKTGRNSAIADQEVYYVVAVKEVMNSDYAPYNSSLYEPALKEMATNQKKAENLIAQYQGKANDMEGYAELMKGTLRTDSTISFNSPRFGAIGFNEPVLRGLVASAKAGELVGPVKTDNMVVVFTAQPIEYQHRDFDYQQDARTFMTTFGMNDFLDMLVGTNKIKNNSLKFIADEDGNR